MGAFTRDELQQAWDHYQEVATRAVEQWDWTEWANLFTEDAEYVEHSEGTFHGRQEIHDWITGIMTGSDVRIWGEFLVRWSFIDEDKGWVVCCFINRAKDPGDGATYEVDNWSLVKYAGDGKWLSQEDIYNRPEFDVMLKAWFEAKAAAGA
jgi:hypothetical protein